MKSQVCMKEDFTKSYIGITDDISYLKTIEALRLGVKQIRFRN
jgi:hypothetical protein